MRKSLSIRCSFLAAAAILTVTPGALVAEPASSSPSAPSVAQANPSKSSPRRKARTKSPENENPIEEMQDVLKEIERLEDRLGRLQKDYGNPDQPFPFDEIKRQYEEATYLYLVEDYEKASLLFYTVIEKASRVTFPEYEEAEFYLAESLALGKNYFPALEYFTRIVEYGPGHRFYDGAVVNMVEIYGKTGNFDKFSTYYQSYIERNKGVKPTPAILYALGKTFYAQEDYPRAIESFSQLLEVGGNYPYFARYFIGTVHVALQEYDKAITAYTELLKLSVNTPEQREVEDLAYLALGRIYSEQGDFARAIDNYQNISRDSRYFADALYEESWTYIKKEDFEQAIRTIDILLLTFPDHVQVPRLKYVRGALQQKRKAYDEALDTYQKLVAEYTGIKEELDRIMREQKDILAYFNELVDSDLRRIESSFLVPALAVRFATSEKDMAQVLSVARDLKLEQRDLEESFRLLNDVETEIYGNPPRNLLVGMRKVRSSLGGMQNLILIAKERIIRAEQLYLADLPDETVSSRVEAMLKQQEEMGRLAKQLPELQRDLTEMVEVYEDQVQEVQKNAYKLEALIEDLLAQAAAIEKYISYGRENGTISVEVEQDTRFKLSSERDQLDADLQALSQVQREIGELDVRRYIRQSYVAEEEQFRRQAEEKLARSRQELAALRSAHKGDGTFFTQSDAAYERLDKLSRAIQEFYGQLDGIEEMQVANIKKSLAREKENLNEYGALAQTYGTETGALAEQIARQSFGRIHKQFSNLILSADFGITDLYWELKEEKSKEIDQNQEQRATEIEALQEKFSGLQAGDL